jgi:hypothetical protein
LIALAGTHAQNFETNQSYSDRSFDSAWKAVFSFERDLNREIFNKKE